MRQTGSARVIAVNTGREAEIMIGRTLARSAIDKRANAGPVPVGRLGLAGDEQADKENHGGAEQAVYAYSREDLDWWAEHLGCELRSGQFGENITTAGLDVTGALIGEIWRLGTAVVQVTSPRIPCATFQAWMGEPHWVRRFADVGRPGAYLRVLEEGMVGPGSEVAVLDRPAARVTVAESMLAYYGDAGLMCRLLTVEGRGGKWDEVAAAVLGRATA